MNSYNMAAPRGTGRADGDQAPPKAPPGRRDSHTLDAGNPDKGRAEEVVDRSGGPTPGRGTPGNEL